MLITAVKEKMVDIYGLMIDIYGLMIEVKLLNINPMGRLDA